MSTWVAIDEDLPDNDKTFNLRRILGLKKKRDAVGLIACLFIFTLRNAWKDGNLEQYGAFGIAEACEWDGDPDDLVQALRDCGGVKDGKKQSGFLDEWVVHNWVKKANKLIRDRLYRENQKVAKTKGKSIISPEARELWNDFAGKNDLEVVGGEELNTRMGISVAKLKDLIPLIEEQPYLLGQGDGGWKVDLAWLTKPANQRKIEQMQYARRNGPGRLLPKDDWKERSRDILKKRSRK